MEGGSFARPVFRPVWQEFATWPFLTAIKRRNSHFAIATSTGWLEKPPTVRYIGTASPTRTSAGTLTFAWNRPAMAPGAAPAHNPSADSPPTVAVTGSTGFGRGWVVITPSALG